MQIYFLVITTNILAGLILSGSFLEEKFSDFSTCNLLLQKPRFKLILGIVAILSAIFTLLMRINPGDIIFVGNLLPALSGLVMGTYLILSFFYNSLEEERSWMKSFVDLMEDQGHIFGLAGILIGIIHFLVPSAIIL